MAYTVISGTPQYCPVSSQFVVNELYGVYKSLISSTTSSPCVTFTDNDNTIICGFTSTNTSNLPNGQTCAVQAYTYTIGVSPPISMQEAISSNTTGWIVPYSNATNGVNGQEALSLSGRFDLTNHIIAAFYEPNTVSGSNPCVWYKSVVCSTAVGQNSLRIAHTGAVPVKLYPTVSAVNEPVHLEGFESDLQWQYVISDLQGRILKQSEAIGSDLERELNFILNKPGLYFLQLYNVATNRKENFKLEKL